MRALEPREMVNVAALPKSHFSAHVTESLHQVDVVRQAECTQSEKVHETPLPGRSLESSEWGKCSSSVCQTRSTH